MNNFSSDYDRYKKAVEEEISAVLNGYSEDIPSVMLEAMKYSVCDGGKRIRGVLMLATSEMLGVETAVAVKYAAAVEMIHASSLIHDDMPCMDNDTMRRGKPCNHIKFGEANALYAGLGLLNLSYEILLKDAVCTNHINAVYALAKSAGPTGIMKGQSLDILYEGKETNFEILKEIHRCKTGELIKACVVVPGLLKAVDKETANALETYGNAIGVAFQIVDDILDVTATSNQLGKTAGKDIIADKLTYAKMFGVEKATKLAEEQVQIAVDSLKNINKDSRFLEETAKLILNRRN